MSLDRPWFVKVKFKAAENPFYFGTVFAETEMMAGQKLKERLAKILPTVPDIELYELVPGQIIIQLERA